MVERAKPKVNFTMYLDNRLKVSALVAGLSFLPAACNGTPAPVPEEAAPLSGQQAGTPGMGVPEATMNLSQQIESARNDLARRLEISPESVQLSGARHVTWRSGAVGCPEPGMHYTQALVPGSLIYLRIGNDVHRYHAPFGRKPFYCPRERAEQPVYGEGADVT